MNKQSVWRKSSRSGSGSGCVEIYKTLTGVRDSKNPDGPVLRLADANTLAAFVRAAPSFRPLP